MAMAATPEATPAAKATRQDLEPSPGLGIVERGPKRFERRKLRILITDGVDAKLLKALTSAGLKGKAWASLSH